MIRATTTRKETGPASKGVVRWEVREGKEETARHPTALISRAFCQRFLGIPSFSDSFSLTIVYLTIKRTTSIWLCNPNKVPDEKPEWSTEVTKSTPPAGGLLASISEHGASACTTSHRVRCAASRDLLFPCFGSHLGVASGMCKSESAFTWSQPSFEVVTTCVCSIWGTPEPTTASVRSGRAYGTFGESYLYLLHLGFEELPLVHPITWRSVVLCLHLCLKTEITSSSNHLTSW